MTVTKGRRPPVEFELMAKSADGVLASAFSEVTHEYREAARERVGEMAERWKHRRCGKPCHGFESHHHCRDRTRAEYNELLVLAQLGLATEEEEEDVWWRYQITHLSGSPFRSQK